MIRMNALSNRRSRRPVSNALYQTTACERNFRRLSLAGKNLPKVKKTSNMKPPGHQGERAPSAFGKGRKGKLATARQMA